MAEPISSANDAEETTQPTNAEDRKAAAALDALNANAISQDNGETQGSKQPSSADQEALMKAMGRLEAVVGGGAKPTSKMSEDKKEATKKEAEVIGGLKLGPRLDAMNPPVVKVAFYNDAYYLECFDRIRRLDEGCLARVAESVGVSHSRIR